MFRNLLISIAVLAAVVTAGSLLSAGSGLNKGTGSNADGVTALSLDSPPNLVGKPLRPAPRMVIDGAARVALGGVAFSVLRNGDLRPPGDALAFVRSLLPASESGDALASYSIFLAVLDCRRLLRGPVHASGEPGRVLEQLAECAPLLEAPGISSRDWLTFAADQGSIEAMLLYPGNPTHVLGEDDAEPFRQPERVIEWKQRAQRYLKAAAGAGSQDAMLALSRAYGDGIVVEKDREREYAYAIVAQKMHPIVGLDQLIESYGRRMTPSGRQRGRELAGRIYVDCCERK